MNIVARLKDDNEVARLSALGVDVFLLDTDVLTTKAIFPLDKKMFVSMVNLIKNENKRVYVWLNKMIHESDLIDLRSWFNCFLTVEIDGIVINDFSVYVLAREFHLEDKIIYQPGTMNTNSFDVVYLENRIKGMTLSKEITLAEIEAIISQKTNLEFSLVGHGYIDMFYSKRHLISLYLEHKKIKGYHVKNSPHYSIEEKTRPGIHFPIFEDEKGTHIFRDKKLESFKEVECLKDFLSDFFIERLFLSDQEYYDAISSYVNHQGDAFLAKYGKEYHDGFYYLPTQKVKGEHYED